MVPLSNLYYGAFEFCSMNAYFRNLLDRESANTIPFFKKGGTPSLSIYYVVLTEVSRTSVGRDGLTRSVARSSQGELSRKINKETEAQTKTSELNSPQFGSRTEFCTCFFFSHGFNQNEVSEQSSFQANVIHTAMLLSKHLIIHISFDIIYVFI